MSKWFERHPFILHREIHQLSSHGDYRQVGIACNQVLLSAGTLLLRLNGKVSRYPAAFLYPDSTPFALPTVFLLERELTEQEVTKLAASSFAHATASLGQVKRLIYQRHQNSNGSLCLLEQDNVEQLGAETFDAHSIINRVVQWLKALELGTPIPESKEVELYAHFPGKAATRILLTETYFTTVGQQGRMYFTPLLQEPRKTLAKERLFIGAGILVDGISMPPDDGTVWHFMPDGINSPNLLYRYPAKAQRATKQFKLLEGYWWQVAQEPPVLRDTEHLLAFLGGGNINQGLTRISSELKTAVTEARQPLLIGLRFTNRKGSPEWLMLKLEASETPQLPKGALFRQRWAALSIYACPVEAFTAKEYHTRNAGRVAYDVISQQAVTVVGCGALGSEVADCLGKAGVGSLHLVDNQLLHPHNSVRHLASYAFAELPKAIAVRHLVKLHNFFIEATPAISNVLNEPLDKYLLPSGIGICTIADDNAEEYINEQAVNQGRTIFYARALRGGKMARIFRVIPGQDACFHCLILYKREQHPNFISVPDDEQLPTIRNECNNPIRPASAADLKLIASLTSRLLLDHLQAPTPGPVNQWIWATEPLPGRPATSELPFVLETCQLPPHEQCPYCNARTPTAVAIRAAAYAFMQEETIGRAGTETGGILTGHIQPDGAIHVLNASGPGPAAVHSTALFKRDVAYCQQFLADEEKAGRVYVGEWHSHPNENNNPSQTDLTSLAAIAYQLNYHTSKPVMLIFSRSGRGRCTVHPIGAPHYLVEPIFLPDPA
ncbi:ThiF family adenylyltransferase [Hymenobacter guriensis]|uniref:ThiF family adenylyltransferase n=1 Tax=Hymenobacter guriensis TaxID=2793065 RepID=A0ABS0L7I1_9BACT|nr:ThiF family adenylyltransferase [Hymenobacter guriensis]MBG8556105.1 ThiF family adenylyltransferase [Hymenobacter guriensis]